MVRGLAWHAARAMTVCLMSATAPALADRPPSDELAERRELARTLAKRGIDLYDAERWQEAYDQLRAADDAYHAPTLTHYMALSLSRLGKLIEARALFQKLLAEPLPSDAPAAYREAQESARRGLDILSHRIPSFHVIVTGIPYETADVRFDGAALPEGRQQANPGTHTIEARAADGQRVRRTLTLAEGADEQVDLALPKPEPPPAAIPGPRPSIWISGAVTSAVAASVGAGLAVGSGMRAAASHACETQPSCDGASTEAARRVEFDRLQGQKVAFAYGSLGSFIGAGAIAAGTVTYALVETRATLPRVGLFVYPGGGAASASIAW